MSRIAFADERSRNPLVRFTSWYSRRRFGRVPDPVRVTAHHPLLLAGYGTLELALERSGRVDKRLKELGALKAAALVGCEFCMDFGSMIGRHTGLSERQLLELGSFRESDAFSAEERLVLELAQAMTLTPAEIPDELFASLSDRFDEAQLVELTAAIALENYRARFNHTFGLGSQGFSEGAACVRPEAAATAGA